MRVVQVSQQTKNLSFAHEDVASGVTDSKRSLHDDALMIQLLVGVVTVSA